MSRAGARSRRAVLPRDPRPRRSRRAVRRSGLEGGPGISDTGVYQRYGERIAGGDLPYRDFAVEYPPGALVPFVAAGARLVDARTGTTPRSWR